MAEVWYPRRAGTILGNSGGSWAAGYPARGVLHTTEGSTASGATSAYSKNNSWPHFTLSETAKVFQHLAINVAARALRNLSGGVDTNRAHAIQIEIVGFASKPTAYSKAQLDALRDLMRWIEQNAGVKSKGPGRAFATKYGQKELRFTNAEWYNFDGWCGHCHVPENDHWDPGAIDLESLLSVPAVPSIVVGTPMEVDVQLTPVSITLGPLDGQGNGWTKVPYTIDKIVGLVAHSGTRPGVDGAYDATPTLVSATPDGAETVIVVRGGNPGGSSPIWFHVIQ